jgi:cytochrome c553
MKRHRLATGATAALGALGFVSIIAQAQTRESAQMARGAVIAAQGTVTGAPPCAQCHAFNGVSDASGAFPRVAGQSAYYLAEQLRDFASGVRSNALMTPIAKALTADDIANVAAYFAGLDAPFLPLRKPDEALVKGRRVARKSGE